MRANVEKSKCLIKTFNNPESYRNCFQLLMSLSKKTFTTSTNRYPDNSGNNMQNSKNHNPRISEQDQAGKTVKITWPSYAQPFCCVVHANCIIGHQFLRTDRVLWRMCLSRVRDREEQKCKVSGDRKSLISTGKPAHSAKITAWCGIHANAVLDPYYFTNKTLRGADYYDLLSIYVRNSSIHFEKTICSNKMEHSGIQVMFSVLFIID